MTPDAGDIMILNFDPQAGRESQKRRPALVLSPKAFNTAMSFAVMCPITSTRSQHKMQLELPSGIKNFSTPGGGLAIRYCRYRQSIAHHLSAGMEKKKLQSCLPLTDIYFFARLA